jgi:uncharacterized membrane protein
MRLTIIHIPVIILMGASFTLNFLGPRNAELNALRIGAIVIALTSIAIIERMAR